MAGRLARWLRLLGYDAEYLNTPDKMILVRMCRSQSRRILTRDARLAARFPQDVVLLASEDLREQIRQVKDAFSLALEPEQLGSRCSLCNAALVHVKKAAVRDRVPAYTYERREAFRECPVCRRVYWRGDHWKRMEAVLCSLRACGGQ